jgi:exosome complex component RRP40
MNAQVGDIVLPGYTVAEAEALARENKKVILGNGLMLDGKDKVLVTKSGVVCKRKNIFYVDSYQKRYIPAKNDTVIGIVQSRTLEFFWVDINCAELARGYSQHFS